MLVKLRIVAALALLWSGQALAADAPGVTASEIKVGSIFPFGGPASALGLVGRAVLAYVQSVNDRGGVNGRKINFIAYDDGYSPPKALEQARKLVESDEVAFLFGQVGTPGNTAVAKFLISKRVPTVAIISGSSKFGNIKEFPFTTTSLVSFESEGKIYAKFLKEKLPDAKYAILYQNDDLGKDYVNAFKDVLGSDFARKVVTAAYEVTSPTIESQIVGLKSSGAEALLIAGTPKFAAQAIRRASEIGWSATIILNIPSSSVGAVLKPAGLDKSTGAIAGAFFMDPMDQQWADNAGMKSFHEFINKYMPNADISDSNYAYGYNQGALLEQLLKQCGNDLSRENILRQAKNLKNVALPTALPGIKVNTSETNNMNLTQMRLQRWSGTKWEPFTEVLDAKSE